MISKDEYMEMYHIIGAAMEVFNTLGHGMSEAIYQEALAMEMEDRGIPTEREKLLHMSYKGRPLKKYYMADLIGNNVLIEIKSCNDLCSEHRAQLFNYMRITQTKRALLINFGEKHLHTERYILDNDSNQIILLTEANLHQYINPT